MKVEYINPFIESVYNLFSSMLGCSVTRGNLAVASPSGSTATEITGIIGLSGPARGTVALSFPLDTARAMVDRLLPPEGTDGEENVSDGVAELVNMVAGSAKAKFDTGDGSPVINLSLPTVIRGQGYGVESPKQSTWLDVPFASDLGPFKLRVTFDFEKKKGVN
jgi:chemotaxis protein CheX